MKSWVVAVLVLVGLIVIAIGVGGWALLRRPLATFAWLGERSLTSAGFEHRSLATSTGTLVYWNGGAGPPLVLLHGAGDRAASWSKVAPDLVGRHRVLIPDLAGHGRSDPAAGPISVEMILGGLEALLEAESSDRPVTLAGNSMGGWMAMLVALRHPDRVERVIAVNGGALRGEEEVDLQPASRAEAYALLQRMRAPSSPAVPAFVVDDIVRQAQRGSLARFASTQADMERWILDGRLGEITVPVDLVWGESDRVMPLAYARRMLAELPDARLTTIPNCGHVPQLECPAAFLAALRAALSEAP